jgi:hypothetical protein
MTRRPNRKPTRGASINGFNNVQDSAIAVGTGARANNTVNSQRIMIADQLAALRSQLDELRLSGGHGLSDDELDDVDWSLERLDSEMDRPAPRVEKVTPLLNRLTRTLSSVAGLGTAVASVVSSVHAVLGQ